MSEIQGGSRLPIEEERNGDMDVWKEKVQQDIQDLKNQQSRIDGKVSETRKEVLDLRMNDQRQDQEIENMKQTLTDIKEDTQWIRRKITGAIITTIITAAVGGVVAYAVSQILGG